MPAENAEKAAARQGVPEAGRRTLSAVHRDAEEQSGGASEGEYALPDKEAYVRDLAKELRLNVHNYIVRIDAFSIVLKAAISDFGGISTMSETTRSATPRREFLKNTARIAAVSALAGVAIPHVHAGEDNTIRLALIGCGGRGSGAVANALSAGGLVMEDRFRAKDEKNFDSQGPVKLSPWPTSSRIGWISHQIIDQGV